MKSTFRMLTLAAVGASLLAVAAPSAPSVLAQDAAPAAAGTTPSPTAVPISVPLPEAVASPIAVSSKSIDDPSERVKATIQIPVVGGIADTDYQQKLNDRIQQQALSDFETIKQEAEEAFADSQKNGYDYHQYELYISYKVKSGGNADDRGILSLEVSTYTYTGGAHGNTRVDLYNATVNAQTASDLTLEQALGEGGLAKADQAMRDQFARPNNFFAEAINSFKGVSPEQPFFVEQGIVNLVFGQYEIAPYAAGIVNIPVVGEDQAAPWVAIEAEQTVKNEAGVTLVPLRIAAETLGFDVEWRGGTRSAELSRGAQWTSVTVDENRYFVNKMAPVALSAAPIIVNDTMYVPVDFFDGILGLRVVATATGSFGISG